MNADEVFQEFYKAKGEQQYERYRLITGKGRKKYEQEYEQEYQQPTLYEDLTTPPVPPKKVADRSGRPGGARREDRLMRDISNLNESVNRLQQRLQNLEGEESFFRERIEAVWRLVSPLPSYANLATVELVQNMLGTHKTAFLQEVEGLMGGIEVQLQEIQEDLYGSD